MSDPEGITVEEAILEAMPDSDPELPNQMFKVAHRHFTRYRRVGLIADLDKAISMAIKAIDLTPESHPQRTPRLLFMQTRELGVIEENIAVQREAVEVTPISNPKRVLFLANLAAPLTARHQILGKKEDLDEAIQICHDVIAQTDENSPQLLERLGNLSLALSERYDTHGDQNDLEEAIEVVKQAIEVTEEDSLERMAQLSNYANFLGDRYLRTGSIRDLEESIHIFEMVCDRIEDDEVYLDRHKCLSNFGIQLSRRYRRIGTVATASPRSPADSIEVELSRRIWWTIYCLDRIVSVCLGRPMAANDSDCCCALPLPLGDEEVDTLYSLEGTLDHDMNPRSALSGFLDLIGLCKVSGEVQSIQSPTEIRDLGTKVGQKRVMDLALGQEKSLDIWLKDLPEHLQSSESIMSAGSKSELSVQSLIIHDGTLVALYQTFARRKHSFSQRQTVENCVTAARSCINNSRHMRDFVPPSHYLALCVNYLTISGLVLLRMTNPESIREDTDLHLCIQLLGDLEVTWSGATRGKIIIEEVLRTFQDNQEGQQMNMDFQTLFQNPDLDLGNLDLSEGFFENFWGTFV
ncbi:Putative transcriptional regulatory protein C3C7.04 [Fusarium oxysporum f. sp. cubense race 1]|uniref:Putative transcriptional regulatory protein C3C7.04 n=1 Tax=Fusarium oxysporum f. sp. cubense (strain race 1) TaxID=1229664 RepID=N4UB29_FUSC1|nr:Putative transcriptional regulatory protein C3C7.04 [Fusarium oxysporum f. sp. cubense race 1]